MGQSLGDLGRLMGLKVVEDHMNVEMSRNMMEVDQFEECEHVLGCVAIAGGVEDLAGGDIEHGEQVGGAVALFCHGSLFSAELASSAESAKTGLPR